MMNLRKNTPKKIRYKEPKPVTKPVTIADEWSHKGSRVDSASANNHEEKILEKLTGAK